MCIRDSCCVNYKSFINSFKNLITQVYSSHKYLLNSQKLDEEKKNRFNRFYQVSEIPNLEDYELYGTVQKLAYLLNVHFGKSCIVLIDDYDVTVHQLISQSASEVHQIINFITEFTSMTLKSNPFVERALINTCSTISGILPSDVHIKRIHFLRYSKFSKFYGLTELSLIHI